MNHFRRTPDVAEVDYFNGKILDPGVVANDMEGVI